MVQGTEDDVMMSLLPKPVCEVVIFTDMYIPVLALERAFLSVVYLP